MSLISTKALVGASAVVAALSIAAPAVQAQPAEPAQQASQATLASTDNQAGAGTDGGTLQEVVVTAERRAVSLQQTPAIVTALQGVQLESLHLTTTTDLQTTVPGFQAQDSGGQYVRYNIRGLGVPANNPAIQIGVKAILDGVVQDLNTGQDQPMYDIADVEVLEGPQGTFVGSSAIGGAVEINTVNPKFDGVNGYVLSGVGNYQDVKTQGAVNLPVTDTFAMRLAFNFEQRHSFSNDIGDTLGGYYYQTYSAVAPQTDGARKGLLQGTIGTGSQIDPGSVDSHQVRLKGLWKPTDNFQSLTEFMYNENNDGGTPAEPNPFTYQNLFAYPSGCSTVAGTTFTGNQLVCTGAGAVTHSQYYYPGQKPFQLDYYGTGWEYYDITWQVNEELKFTLPDGIELRSLSGFVHLETQEQDDKSFGPENAGWNYKPNGPNYIPSEEVDVISPTTGKLNWIAGAYYEYRDAPVPGDSTTVAAPYQPSAQPTVLTISAPAAVPGRVAAMFGQINWHFTDTLELQVGARENYDVYNTAALGNVAPATGTVLNEPNGGGTYSILNTGCGAYTPPCYKVVAPQVASGKYDDTVPTGKVDINWTPLPGQNFYAFYARGYSAGGINSGSENHPYFNPMYANDWEAGWKGLVFDRHVTTQVGLYYEKIENYQYPILDTAAQFDTSTGTYVANFAPSLIDGVSAAAQGHFGGLGIDGSFDYNHTSLGDVKVVNSGAFPAGFGSPLASPQCEAGHAYTAVSCFDYTPYTESLGGEPIPRAPEVQEDFAVDYLLHVGLGTLDPRVTWSHTSLQYGTIFENAYNVIQARSLLGASIDWVVGNWDSQFWGTNLTNVTYVSTNEGPDVYYGPPRQYGFQETFHF